MTRTGSVVGDGPRLRLRGYSGPDYADHESAEDTEEYIRGLRGFILVLVDVALELVSDRLHPEPVLVTLAASPLACRLVHVSVPSMAKRSRGLAYEELTVSSWPEFVDLVSSSAVEGWAFRGQERAEWPLFSSLSRYLLNFVPDHKRWGERERRSIRIFSRKAHHFIFHPDELDQVFMCVSHMQHHGAPTRLLDFTKSPFVAAFFALERATGDAAVWAVNAFALHQGVRLRGKVARYGSRDAIDPRTGDNFARHFLTNRASFVWVGEPYKMNLRLIAQSGTFVVPGVLDQPVESILSGYPRPKELLLKIVLPAQLMRQQGMAALYRMNITHASLFPDLDGLARSQAYELEIEWRGLQQVPAQDRPTK